MFKFLAIAGILLGALTASGQVYNDTIVYKSGLVKVVEITEFNKHLIYYDYVNTKGDSTSSTANTGVVRYFRTYDADGIMEYDSFESGEFKKVNVNHVKYPDSVTVSRHTVSVNPFSLVFLSPSTKYTYNFGKKMQLGIVARATYVSPILGVDHSAIMGVGIKLTPFYNDRISLGVDFTPMIALGDIYDPPSILVPVNLDLDVYLNKYFGLSFDFGMGMSYWEEDRDYIVRGHFGLLFSLPQKVTFATNY